MKELVVLVSGSGSNLQRIIDCIDNGVIKNAKVSLVIADRDCFALTRAANHNIESIVIPRGKSFSQQLSAVLPQNTTLIVLAGFLSILNSEFCEKWQRKIINIHPALLPSYGGKGMWGHHVHLAVLNNREQQTGATVHYVTSGVDEGEIILQKSTQLSELETIETIAEKVHQIEFEIFPLAINKVLNP